MKAFPGIIFSFVIATGVFGDDALDQARKLEASGDSGGARTALARTAQASPSDVSAQANYAEFLDRYGDPQARAAYGKVLAAARQAGDKERAALAARRLAVLDLLAGDGAAASRSSDAYREITGKTLTLASAPGGAAETRGSAPIPGPLRSFARMAAISADTLPEDILPAVARNVVTNGYQASHSNDALEQTEYLKLVHRYLSQARELDRLASDGKIIKVEACESPAAADLIRVLGFRMRGGCGSEVVLETVNAARAFLTTDSGFPLADLEQALRTNRPFTLDYRPADVPVYFGPEYWISAKEKAPDFIETFLSDPSMCRLYLGYSKLDRETAEALRKGLPYPRLKAFAHLLDFFGAMF